MVSLALSRLVQSHNSEFDVVYVENLPLIVNIEGPNGHVAALTEDRKDGTYEVLYTPPLPGMYTINVTIADR